MPLQNVECYDFAAVVPAGELVSRYKCLASGALASFSLSFSLDTVSNPEPPAGHSVSGVELVAEPQEPLDTEDWLLRYREAYQSR